MKYRRLFGATCLVFVSLGCKADERAVYSFRFRDSKSSEAIPGVDGSYYSSGSYHNCRAFPAAESGSFGPSDPGGISVGPKVIERFSNTFFFSKVGYKQAVVESNPAGWKLFYLEGGQPTGPLVNLPAVEPNTPVDVLMMQEESKN